MCTSHSRPKNQPSKQTKRLRAGHAGEISVRPRPAGRGGLLRADALECALTLLREADNRMLSASAGALSAPTTKEKRPDRGRYPTAADDERLSAGFRSLASSARSLFSRLMSPLLTAATIAGWLSSESGSTRSGLMGRSLPLLRSGLGAGYKRQRTRKAFP